jgi:hypothetical protein
VEYVIGNLEVARLTVVEQFIGNLEEARLSGTSDWQS